MYGNCSCVREAWDSNHFNFSEASVKRNLLSLSKPISAEDINTAQASLYGSPISGASEGWCPVNCDGDITTYMMGMSVIGIFFASGKIGSALLSLRCVDIQDKPLSMVRKHFLYYCVILILCTNDFQAFNVVLLSLFGMPAPIVYGAMVDNTCIIWQESCDGGTGNCLLYDTVKLRMTLMLTTGAHGL